MGRREAMRKRERQREEKENWVKRFNVLLKIGHSPEVQMFHQSNGSPAG